MAYQTYDEILENCESDDDAIAYANGIVWMENETRTCEIANGRFIKSVNGVDVYYDFGADYYFFVKSD
jgi:hypothetical protein